VRAAAASAIPLIAVGHETDLDRFQSPTVAHRRQPPPPRWQPLRSELLSQTMELSGARCCFTKGWKTAADI
jgi:hypothetical protein